jgi:phage terminase small subunit
MACQLRAGGKSQRAAHRIAFRTPEGSKANNSSSFFKRSGIRARVAELVRRRAVLAELDDGWVLMQLKAVAENGIVVGNANLDDYFEKDAAGVRLGISLARVSADKMAALDEVTIEEFVEGRGEEARTVRRTKIKLRSAATVIAACELIGKWLGMWKDKAGLANPTDGGPQVIEVYWKGSPQEDSAEAKRSEA